MSSSCGSKFNLLGLGTKTPQESSSSPTKSTPKAVWYKKFIYLLTLFEQFVNIWGKWTFTWTRLTKYSFKHKALFFPFLRQLVVPSTLRWFLLPDEPEKSLSARDGGGGVSSEESRKRWALDTTSCQGSYAGWGEGQLPNQQSLSTGAIWSDV